MRGCASARSLRLRPVTRRAHGMLSENAWEPDHVVERSSGGSGGDRRHCRSQCSVGAVGGPYLTSRVDYFTRNREMDIKMVEIAVGIFGKRRKEGARSAPARAWAADVIHRYSEIPLLPRCAQIADRVRRQRLVL